MDTHLRAFQWIPTWQGFDDLQKKTLHPSALGESSLRIWRAKHRQADSFINPYAAGG